MPDRLISRASAARYGLEAARRAASILLSIALVSPDTMAEREPTVARRIGTATLENVPPIPPSVSAAVQRYQNYRAAELEGWLSDGSLLIATRFGATRQIHRVEHPGAARVQLTFFDEPVAQASAIPGTRRFIAVSDAGGDEWFQFFLAGPGEVPIRITEPGTRNESPVVSDDGSLVAWARATPGSARYAVLTVNPREPGDVRQVQAYAGAIEIADVSPDGTQLVVVRRISNRETELFLLDLATGHATELLVDARPSHNLDPIFSADGESIFLITNASSDVGQLVELDLATGERTVLVPGLDWEVEAAELSADGRYLAYAVNEEGYSRVAVIDRRLGRTVAPADLPRGVATNMAFSPDGRHLAIGLSSATMPGDVFVLDVAKESVTRWTASELGEIDPARLVEPGLVRFESFDGLEVPAFIYRPYDAGPEDRTPVIIDIHGGPESQARPVWNPGAQYFADTLGASVILPNVRGSAGYGTRYLDLDNAEKREDSVRDIGALLDWIAAEPRLDRARVAVYGQSYGGYMSLASMTHYADRLVGGVERYGISDFASFLRNTEDYRRDLRRAEYGDERDARMQTVFRRIAPLANVERITKPMLVMQGANDPRVPQSESDQIVSSLRDNGVEVWYVVFADEGHGFLKKHNNDLRRAVETVFLERLFGEGEDPSGQERPRGRAEPLS